jgi:hypothetical protein
MVKRLLPSSLMYVIIQELKLYFVNTSLIYKVMPFLVMLIVSKKSTITWQYSHLEFKKCTRMMKVSIPTLDIHNQKIWCKNGKIQELKIHIFLQSFW